MPSQTEVFYLWLRNHHRNNSGQTEITVPDNFARLPCGDTLPVDADNPKNGDGRIRLVGSFKLEHLGGDVYRHVGCTQDPPVEFRAC